jgi:hypothetical protein
MFRESWDHLVMADVILVVRRVTMKWERYSQCHPKLTLESGLCSKCLLVEILRENGALTTSSLSRHRMLLQWIKLEKCTKRSIALMKNFLIVWILSGILRDPKVSRKILTTNLNTELITYGTTLATRSTSDCKSPPWSGWLHLNILTLNLS